ncbi:Alpha/beta hydrolase fold-1 [Hypoxylon rubiginosum]|uniref:Alpha/beta hydrolase fold-1 n=1 Tax=Hypoxylon rubiginosum TaxID=110542 RepID=A0ACC0CY05_9PEZI|nr:Alpha/beta hydrolase fold-1 [Hypoxylon rubiginosum]
MGQLSMLIVPGASALPEFYSPAIDIVAARGFEIKALHIPSVGIPGPREGPPPTMYDDAKFVATHVKDLADAGNDVILITHSYGGVPATQSVQGLSKKEREAQGLKGGIIGIAYITSLVPNIGEPAASVQAPLPQEDKVPTAMDDRGWFFYPDIPRVAAISFSDMPQEEGEHWARKLAYHSAASFAGPLTYPGFKDVPVSYLLCLDDLSIPAEIQKSGIDMIERETGRKVAVTSIEASHVAPLSHPEEVAKWIVQLADRKD